jgi:uncharacterized membrane protein YcaP (DUF421 family)
MSFADLFAVRVSALELVVRGTALYWFLFLLFRFVLRRDVGQIGVADVLLLVLIADASQNAMAGGYETITEGVILVSTIAGWNWLLDWLAYHSPLAARFIEPPTLLIVRNGRAIVKNMQSQLLSMEDLQSQLRQQGIESLRQVKRAQLESDGRLSVITYEHRQRPQDSTDGGQH